MITAYPPRGHIAIVENLTQVSGRESSKIATSLVESMKSSSQLAVDQERLISQSIKKVIYLCQLRVCVDEQSFIQPIPHRSRSSNPYLTLA